MKRVVPWLFVVAASILIVAVAAVRLVTQHRSQAAIAIDYRADGAVFPPEITAPTF